MTSEELQSSLSASLPFAFLLFPDLILSLGVFGYGTFHPGVNGIRYPWSSLVPAP